MLVDRRALQRGRTFPIARKLAVAMALPLVATVVVLGLEIGDVDRESSAVRRQSALAVSADGPSRLLISLQNEQGWATLELIGLDAQADLVDGGYDETRGHTDEAMAGFEAVLERSPAEIRRAFRPAVDGLATGLGEIRERIDDAPTPRSLGNLPLSREVFTATATWSTRSSPVSSRWPRRSSTPPCARAPS